MTASSALCVSYAARLMCPPRRRRPPMSQPLAPPTRQALPLSAADRLGPTARAVLRGAARGLCCESGGFQAAELWLLDDATRSLRLAARWTVEGSASAATGVPNRRSLERAPADVAALAGGAVVLESPAELAAWDLHALTSGAAIGLPVSSDTTIHGVMWLLADDAKQLADGPVELAEVVAGRLALEVEKAQASGAPATPERPAPKPLPPIEAKTTPLPATPRREEAEPESNESSYAIEYASWTTPHAEQSRIAMAECFALPEGRLLALTTAVIDSPQGELETQRAAIAWLLAEAPEVAARAHDAGVLLTLLNRRMVETPLAGEGLAVAAALLDAPEDLDEGLGGAGTFAIAGPTVALSVRASQTHSHAGDLVPVGWNEPQAAYAPRPFELAVRERLILVAGDPRLTSPLAEGRLGDIYRSVTADDHRVMTAEECLRRLAAGSEDALAAAALRRR